MGSVERPKGFGIACTVAWTELVNAMRADGHPVGDKSGPNTRAWMEAIVADTFAAALREQPEARGVVDGPVWKPIDELPSSDDLFWFARGDTVDGPRPPQFGGYDAEEWDWFAPAEAPPFTAAQQPVQEGGGEVAMYQVSPKGKEHWREVSKRQFDDEGEFPGYPSTEWNRRILYTAPPSAPVGVCQRCAGSGTMAATDTTRGPDGHDFDANCPHCDGTGDVHRADGEWLGTCVCAATQQPAQAAPGWKLVPVEASPEMVDAFRKAHDEHAALRIPKIYATGQREEANVIVGYRAMLAATPPGDDAAGGGP